MTITKPTLTWVAEDFERATNGVPASLTFTRATTATYVDAFGRIASSASGVLRHDFDPVTSDPLGWRVSTQRTNLTLNSGDIGGASDAKSVTITADQVTAPDGTLNGNKIEDTSEAAVQEVNQAITVANDGATYVASIFLKAGDIGTDAGLRLALSGGTGVTADLTANLSTGAIANGTGTIKNYGNGWYRVSVSVTNNTSGNTALTFRLYPSNTSETTGYIYAWGRQIEAGADLTSYIPTAGAPLTRNADALTVASAGLVNPTEGTLYFHGDVGQISGSPPLVALRTDINNQVQLYLSGSSATAYVINGGAVQVSLNAGTVSASTAFKLAVAYKANDFAACLNAGAVATDTSGTVPAVTTLELGSAPSAGTLNGHIRHVAYFPRRLSNADLQTITG